MPSECTVGNLLFPNHFPFLACTGFGLAARCAHISGPLESVPVPSCQRLRPKGLPCLSPLSRPGKWGTFVDSLYSPFL